MNNGIYKPITFCRKKSCCPTVTPREDGNFEVGGKEEGVSVFTKQHLSDFVAAAKGGKFDDLIKE